MKEKLVKLFLKILLLISGATFFVPFTGLTDDLSMSTTYWIMIPIPLISSLIARICKNKGYNCDDCIELSLVIAVVLLVIGCLVFLVEGQMELL